MTDVADLLEGRLGLEKLLTQLKVQNKHVELSVYDTIVHSLENYNQSLHEDLDRILGMIHEEEASDDPELSKEYKIKSELLEWKHRYGHAPAYIFVLNFEPDNLQHTEHVYRPNTKRPCVGKNIKDKNVLLEMDSLAYEDNAQLLDSKGTIVGTEAQLVDVNPGDIRDEEWLNGRSEYGHGFLDPVHTRHNSSIGASYHMPGIVVYTLGESGTIRRFQQGIITASTIRKEQELAYQVMQEKGLLKH